MAHHTKLNLKDTALLKEHASWIDGQWVKADSGEEFDVLDPATGKKWASCPAMGAPETTRAIDAATRAFPAYSRVPPRKRAQMILELDRLIRAAKNDLAQLLVLETGKPFAEALGEIDYALTFTWWCAGEAERVTGETINGAANPNLRFVTIRQPVGPVGLMVAWNFPVVLACRKLATALAAGCTCVLKPSPESPLTAVAIAILATRAGFAPGVVNVVTASHATTPIVGEVLCTHPSIKKISFTGSTAVGKLLMKQCSSTLKKMCLELGGNGAFVIYDDADLDLTVTALMATKWRHAGQVCTTANRIYVQRPIAAAFLDRFSQAMRTQLKLGAGFDEGTTLGPLTTPQSVERAERHVKDAVAKGGKVLVGGKRPTDRQSGYFFEPTLIVDAPTDAFIAQEETFSPIASVYQFNTEEEVTTSVNATDMGLTNYVFTKNLNRAWRALENFESGTVAINSANPTSAESPFGGIKASGIGKEAGIGAGIEEYLITKTGAMTLF